MEIHSYLQINSVIPVLSFQTREPTIIIYFNMLAIVPITPYYPLLL